MSITVGMVGKVLGRIALGLGVSTAMAYANYRINGGPPIREVYKQCREERIRAEEEKVKAMLRQHVVLSQEDYTVR